jgi:hypothetical protein
MDLPQQSKKTVLDFVRDYIIPFNSIIAMAVTVVAVLDFLAPQGAYLAWFSYALAGLVMLVVALEVRHQRTQGTGSSWDSRLLNRLRKPPGPLWRSAVWVVIGAISILVLILGQASKAQADTGGLIASAAPNLRNVQTLLLGLRENTQRIQDKLEGVDSKVTSIQTSLEAALDDPMERLMQGDYPYFAKRVQAGKGLPQHKLTLLWGLNKKRDDRVELLQLYERQGMNLHGAMPLSALESGVAVEDALTVKNLEKLSAYAKKRFHNPLVNFFSQCEEMDLLVYSKIAGDAMLADWLIGQGLSPGKRYACEFGGERWTTSANEIQAIVGK